MAARAPSSKSKTTVTLSRREVLVLERLGGGASPTQTLKRLISQAEDAEDLRLAREALDDPLSIPWDKVKAEYGLRGRAEAPGPKRPRGAPKSRAAKSR